MLQDLQNKLAIIIPYYKIDFFEKTIQSLVAQTNKNFTLYIGNDASPNNPLPILTQYLNPEEYHYFDYKENVGGKNLALQWERVLENIHEDWFLILGDDDTISENFVDEFYKNLKTVEENKINVIKYSQALIDETDQILTSFTTYKPIESSTNLWLQKLYDGHRSSLSEHIFRRVSYQKYKFKELPLAWHTDDLAVLEFSDFGSVYFINHAQTFVRISSASISGDVENTTYQEQKTEARYQFFGYLITAYYDKFPVEPLKKLINVHLHFCWQHKKKLNIDLYKLYYYLKSYKQLLGVPRKKYLLLKNHNPVWDLEHYTAKLHKVKNKYLYQYLIRYDQHVKSQRQNPLSIPVIIINFNQLHYLKQLISFLQERKFENIVIIDNKSDYPPLLDYYQSIDKTVTIERMNGNFGHKVFFDHKDLQEKYGKGYFIVTDPDIVPNKNLPQNFITEMISKMDKYYNTITKVGFALDIETIPDYFPLKSKVIKWENKFWSHKLEDEVYSAFVDTTFALYKPYYPMKFNNLPFLEGIRIGGSYTALHGGWYMDPQNYTEEYLHYIESVDKSSSWKLDTKGGHDNKGIAKYE
ncbi:Glycosyl transferase family 2 [Chryseobacterium nakagawai]|uniref:Glycosyltransferase n=1 Tax=Chryseobacterium nakagawai TaxID=1241982 RepID=A0AAD0YN60_CHRNA|nr:glycosyltransferase family 2 protein [Chryseobacterium nakagawai]AZA91994.1 glycosyltransferase [Chryseobacterium nakagawai]VEH18518.1 Glycosyl transferase family 2 [Chryseobacterium nakagawai]